VNKNNTEDKKSAIAVKSCIYTIRYDRRV